MTKSNEINTRLSTTLNQSSMSSTDIAGVTLNTFKGVMGLVGIFAVEVPILLVYIVNDAAAVFNLPMWIVGPVLAALAVLVLASVFSILLNRDV